MSKYLKDTEAAEYLGISVHTLRDFRRPGWKHAGPKICKLGRAVRYTKEDLDAWAQGENE